MVLALVPEFEKQTGHTVDSPTTAPAGTLKKRIESGEAFDVAVITPAVIEGLIKGGKLDARQLRQGRHASVSASAVKEGRAQADICTVEKFKRALLAPKRSPISTRRAAARAASYVDNLLVRLGIADQIRPKAKLKNGRPCRSTSIVSGEAELGVHQISEIVPVKGAVLVGPLPQEIQNTTTYAAGMSRSQSNQQAAAQALIKCARRAPTAAAVLKSKGMEPAK